MSVYLYKIFDLFNYIYFLNGTNIFIRYSNVEYLSFFIGIIVNYLQEFKIVVRGVVKR